MGGPACVAWLVWGGRSCRPFLLWSLFAAYKILSSRVSRSAGNGESRDLLFAKNDSTRVIEARAPSSRARDLARSFGSSTTLSFRAVRSGSENGRRNLLLSSPEPSRTLRKSGFFPPPKSFTLSRSPRRPHASFSRSHFHSLLIRRALRRYQAPLYLRRHDEAQARRRAGDFPRRQVGDLQRGGRRSCGQHQNAAYLDCS